MNVFSSRRRLLALARRLLVAVAVAGPALSFPPPLTADAQTTQPGSAGQAQESHHEHRTRETEQTSPLRGEVKIGNLNLSLPDVELLDQNGKEVRFYSDLIKDQVVVLGFFYTSCQYVCEMLGGNFSALQRRLGDRLGRDVHLILVTRDPRVDTPRKLKEWGARYGVRPGWTLLTGRAEDVERVIATFTGDRIGPVETHSAGIYIGNDAAASWTYASGLTPPELLIKRIDQMRRAAAPQASRPADDDHSHH